MSTKIDTNKFQYVVKETPDEVIAKIENRFRMDGFIDPGFIDLTYVFGPSLKLFTRHIVAVYDDSPEGSETV